MPKVAIIGGGEIGQAIAKLCRTGVLLGILDTSQERSTISADKVREADLVFLCVPSQFLRTAIKTNLACMRSNASLVALTKGFEKETNKSVAEVLTETVTSPWGLLSGPMIAEEIVSGQKVEAYVASKHEEVFALVQKALDESKISLKFTPDTDAVALLASLKNVYAIGLGILSISKKDAMEAFAGESLKEMENFLKALHLDTSLVYDLPGKGDLVATGFSPFSLNHSVGRAIASGKDFARSEGIQSLESVRARFSDIAASLPIFSTLYNVVIDRTTKPDSLISLIHE